MKYSIQHTDIGLGSNDDFRRSCFYGVDKKTLERTDPYLEGSVDVMAVGNLPNELPREASEHFGNQLIKYIFEDLITGRSPVIDRATMVSKGNITPRFEYLTDYAEGIFTL